MMSRLKVLEVERGEEEWVVRIKPGEFHLLPTDTKKHIVGAGREALLALRSMLDSAISCAGGADPTAAPENIEVQ